MTIQYRPKDTKDPYYTPHRDLAYIYRSICNKGFQYLDEVNWEEWFGDYLRHTGTTEQQLAEGVRCFAEAHNLFTGDESVEQPADALQRAGFLDQPYPVQVTIYAMVGMITTGSFFMAIRDVTEYGGKPPAEVGIDHLVQCGQELAERYPKSPWTHLRKFFVSLLPLGRRSIYRKNST